ncbi:helix-turn-helix domain-containing protein [Thermosulfidibacter takaii]|uniref:helix-turn-helix domain-containing protein n=1 Tax=Thermosulfidibacter takaii TaxID=412593 RepID=UPI000838AFFE
MICCDQIHSKRLYECKEVAKIMGKSPSYVRHLCWTGKLPTKKIGRRRYILGADLLRFLGLSSEELEK